MNLVHRQTELPVAPGRGHLLVTDEVIDGSTAALCSSSGPDGRHEGLVLWAGRQLGDLTVVTSTVVPETRHGRGHVFMDEAQVAMAARAARANNVGIVAQVHSHSGNDTRHSDGDDHLILMPFEGMFSIVVARYAKDGFDGAGLHQYQDGRWHQIANPDETVNVARTLIQ